MLDSMQAMQAMTPRSRRAGDAPGGGPSKLTATLGAAAILLLFYLLVVATMLFLAVWIAVEWLAGFLGGRFWWAFQARQSFRGHFALAGVFLRSWRLREPAETRIPLARDEAPEFFSMLESLCLRRD